MKKKWYFKLMSLWPPYLGAGIRIKDVADDLHSINVEMKLRWWNKNYVGTQFGGSLYAMTDPFFVLILSKQLGSQYIIWDKAATIRFKSPGNGTVKAYFEITPDEVSRIKKEADENYKSEPKFTLNILDESNTIIAEVEKTLYIRRKDKKKN